MSESEYPYGMTWHGVKRAAGHLRITTDEYLAQMRAGNLWCSDCRAWLPLNQFPTCPSRKTGRTNVCRPHRNQQTRDWHRGIVTVGGGAS